MSGLGPAGLGGEQNFGVTTPGIHSFHRALEAALHSRVALDLGGTAPRNQSGSSLKIPTGRLTLHKLDALQALTRASSFDRPDEPIDPGEVLTATFGELATELPQKYVNGFSVYLITGRTDLVLDAMSVDARAEQELARVARPSLVYLAVIVVTGALGSGVLALTLLVLDHLRDDLLLVPHPLAVSSAAPWITQSQFLMLPWIVLSVVLITAASLLRPVSAGIAKCLGGFDYLISHRRAMASQVERALVLSGIEGIKAEQTAIGLVGLQPRRKRSLRTMSRSDQSLSDLQRSTLEAKHYSARANTRLQQLRFVLPLVLVMTVGAAGVLLYSLALFIPLTNLLHEMATPIVDPVMRWDRR